MAGKQPTPEQIVHELREAEAALSKGVTIAQAARGIGVARADAATRSPR